jgi:hypothetical protein
VFTFATVPKEIDRKIEQIVEIFENMTDYVTLQVKSYN